MVPKKKLIPKKRVRLGKPIKIRFKITRKLPKNMFCEVPTKTLTVAMHAVRWFLFLILIYVGVSVMIMFFTKSYEFLQQVVTLSLGGFFGFFMGYFGWILADHLVTWLKGKRKEKETFDNLDLF